MAIYASQFIFDGVSCDDYNLTMCSFGNSSGVQTSSAGSKIEIKTVKSPNANKWIRYNAQYSEPISFIIQVMKTDGSEINITEQELINRWLVRSDDYKWIQFVQDDHEDLYFNGQATSSSLLSIGNVNYGMEFNFVTDSPYGYSAERVNPYTAIDSQIITFLDQSSEIGYNYPQMTITIGTEGTFAILNKAENRLFQLTNCTVGEVITIDNENKIMTSTNLNHALYDNFNFNFFRFVNTYNNRVNELQITGNATIVFKYRLPRKVGI